MLNRNKQVLILEAGGGVRQHTGGPKVTGQRQHFPPPRVSDTMKSFAFFMTLFCTKRVIFTKY